MSRLDELLELPEMGGTEPLVLAVGVSKEEMFQYSGGLTDSQIEFLPFMLIHAALARAPWAELIVTPLVSDYFDAMDMATELALAGYRGTYAVILPRLPRPEIVRRELNAICPGLRIELWNRARH
ncbi:hypothetical protein [Actibacterium sp.]|uniref:hypothetical protein n=1 Tax=Actibacterium sp. TaxID=1872125 RepID=UPI0035628278